MIAKNTEHGWNGSVYRDRREWMTSQDIDKAGLLPPTSTRRWSKRPCRFLEGCRTIEAKKVDAKPLNGEGGWRGKVKVYLLADIEEIVRNRQPRAAVEIEHRDEEGVWLTAERLEKRLGQGRNFCYAWAKRQSRLRPGAALRSKRIANAIKQKGSPYTVLVYLLADAEAIVEGMESECLYVGKGRNAARRRKARPNAVKVLRDILRGGPLPSDEVISLADAKGVKRHAIYNVKEKAGIVVAEQPEGFWLWRLPGAAGKQKPKPAESNGHTHLDLSHLAHVQTVAFGAVGTVNADAANANVKAARVKVKAKSAKIVSGKPIPKKATLDSLPATHREFGSPNGKPLVPSYLEDEHGLSSAYLSRHLKELEDQRISIGKEYAYSFRDVAAMSRRKKLVDPDPETISKRAAKERQRSGKS